MTDAVEGAAMAAADIAPGSASDAASAAEGAVAAPADAGSSGAGRPRSRALAGVWDAVRTILSALLLSFAIRVVLVEPFHIPSQSMEPTLIAGDFIGAVKYPYGWSRASASPIPLPAIPGRLFGQLPARGELVVFRNPLDGGADYVKRVVGLPGDTVQMRDGVLHVNGQAARTDHLESYDALDPNGAPVTVEVYEEQLAGSCPHQIQHFVYADGRSEGQDDTYEFLVPAGHVFVLGDNRDASYDSRLPGRVGYVPIEEIVGRVEFVLLSVAETVHLRDRQTWTNFRADRTLKILSCA